MAIKTQSAAVTITAPNMVTAVFRIVGNAPYVQLRFPQKAQALMRAKMEKGSQAKKGAKRDPRDFQEDYKQAMYTSTEGWHGIPAPVFRNAMISACRIVGFQMTKAKLAVFCEADGMDKDDATPMIIINGTPEAVEHHVRNATGVADLRVRAMWREWSAVVRLRFDADMFSLDDITNLLARVGTQVGIGEGRPDSKQSAGMGWGTFDIAAQAPEVDK